MPELEFRDPLFLLAGLLAPLVYALAVRVRSHLTYSSLSIPDQAPRSLRVRLAGLPALALAAATICLAIALAGPRTGDATTQVQKDGLAIVMAVDVSMSMHARDFVEDDQSVSRLDAVKQVFHQFVEGGEAGEGRPNDLIGIVAFGTYADGICPLTLDHANLLAILDQLEITKRQDEANTAIGEGLGLAVERLRESKAKSKVVILLTDGVHNAGTLGPREAAEIAAELGVKVYTVGAGRNGFAPFPFRQRDGSIGLRRVRVEIDEETLKEIAERTGGKYFHAQNVEGLAEVYSEIDRLERTEIIELRYVQYEEHYEHFVVAAMGLIAFAVLLGGTFLRRLP